MTTAHLHRRIGVALAGLLAVIALLHVSWALGGRWGLAAALGGPDVPIPPTWSIWLVAGLLVLGSASLIGRVGYFRALPQLPFAVGAWAVTVALAIGAVVNFTASTAIEQFGFGPLSLVLALGAGYVARTPPQTPQRRISATGAPP